MSASKLFPTTRYFSNICYQPFGDSPPEDYLQSIPDQKGSPLVVVLGCGDMRSCFYTLWNNFDPNHSRNFLGVQFVLNDSSAAVMARNVLFIYLCTQISYSDDRHPIATLWSIWFNHRLTTEHHQVLIKALSKLVKWSKDEDSWADTSIPLICLVQFATGTREKLNKMWSMWLEGYCTAVDMVYKRVESLKSTPDYCKMQDPSIVLKRCFGSSQVKKLSDDQEKKMREEITFYYEFGNAYAEKPWCLGGDDISQECTVGNITFFDRPDKKYSIPCTAIPYKCFYHAFYFPFEDPTSSAKWAEIFVGDRIPVQPLLENSIQQFFMWITSCARIFREKRFGAIRFTIQCSDALEFCQQLHHCPQLFPTCSCLISNFFVVVVHSSNLIDFTAPPNLVLLALSALLKDSRMLFTKSFSIGMFNTADDYLREIFGFDSKYLPVLVGARCMVVEGEYSGKVCLKPMPYDPVSCCTTFIWQRITPVTMLTGVPQKNLNDLFKTLCNAIVHILCSSFKSDNKSCVASLLMCTETVILILQSFVAQLDPQSHDSKSYQFWEPLCDMLMREVHLKAFITSLQMHTLLHELHLHLTVPTDKCPMCNMKWSSDFITQHSVNALHKKQDCGEWGYVLVMCKEDHSIDMNKICGEIISGRHDDFHVIDCYTGCEDDEVLKLDVLVPVYMQFLEYRLIVVSMNLNRAVPLSVKKIPSKSMQLDKVPYAFSAVTLHSTSTQSSLGKLSKHYGDADHYQSVISLSDQAMSSLKEFKINTEFSRCATITLQIGSHHMRICYPYPIECDKVSVELSSNDMVVVIAPCKSHCLCEECPVFVVNPNNALALATAFVSPENGRIFSDICYSKNDLACIEKKCQEQKSGEIGRQEKVCCFELVNETRSKMPNVVTERTVVGLVVVHDQAFDLPSRTPPIDLHFCFPTTDVFKQIHRKWMKFCANMAPREIVVSYDDVQLLQTLFKHFADCTVATTSKPAASGHVPKKLADNKIDELFTRAVVYPLNVHEHHVYWATGPIVKPQCFTEVVPDESKCANCGLSFVVLKKCPHCRSVQYCSEDCLEKDWTTHKPDCH